MILNLKLVLILYVLAMNIAAFALMGIDKVKAKKKAWRIPEGILFLFSIFGGSIGSIAGMYIFRHKTRHWYFVIGMPLILILQIAAICILLRQPIDITVI